MLFFFPFVLGLVLNSSYCPDQYYVASLSEQTGAQLLLFHILFILLNIYLSSICHALTYLHYCMYFDAQLRLFVDWSHCCDGSVLLIHVISHVCWSDENKPLFLFQFVFVSCFV